MDCAGSLLSLFPSMYVHSTWMILCYTFDGFKRFKIPFLYIIITLCGLQLIKESMIFFFIAISSRQERICLFLKVILVSPPCLKQMRTLERNIVSALKEHSFILWEHKSWVPECLPNVNEVGLSKWCFERHA